MDTNTYEYIHMSTSIYEYMKHMSVSFDKLGFHEISHNQSVATNPTLPESNAMWGA